jgi:mono/diheme cytochrome c family protein
MKPNRFPAALAAAAVVLAVAVAATAVAAEPSSKKARIARGKYLVESVGMCADCHSPRGPKGEFIREKWLHGSPLDFKNIVPMPAWAEAAPPIAGLPGWTEAQVVMLLTTGKDQKGGMADPPMPQYRMSREDATAVAAYLASLEPPAGK